ncbi:MDR family MFS transporter [Terrilactibacillus laevilacticus]|uniref:MDR family MFS transporter n=1 Tax=Terrilactibacillus laevilacticus TaxID=1380157 RepID=A0ABW5PPF4_9BACI|nr:MDR family MFS transporter [Terrilactibacillus laevilacticus]
MNIVVIGLLLSIFTASMDQTIVSTAMGTIVADLGGLDKFVWVTSAYLVTEMAGMPIFGKLSDMYGRKRFFIFGLCVFLLGSILCGTATSITQLSLYRAIQGIGGGSLMPIAFAIVFNIFPPDQRGKMGGLFGAAFGLSSVFGPLLGAYITDHFSWHWVFYINLPLGILSVVLISFFYKESKEHQKQNIDWWGAITLVIGTVSLMFALELGGNKFDWGSVQIIGLFTSFVIFFLLFLFAETRAIDPILPFKLFRKRLFTASNLIGIFISIPFIVAIVFIPLYVQGVTGGTATRSGLILLPLMVGTTVSSILGGSLIQKVSYRNTMIFSGFVMFIGMILLSTITVNTHIGLLIVYVFFVGFGVGFSFSVLGTAAVHGLSPREFGSASSTLAFLRELGMTVGLTIYGAIQSHILKDELHDLFRSMAKMGSAGQSQNPRVLLSPEVREHIPSNIIDHLVSGLSKSISHTFIWAIIPTVIALICVFVMTNEKLIIEEKQTKQSF